MNSLKIFNSNEFGKMRTYRDPNTGEVWFNLNDICNALGIANSRNVRSRLDDDVCLTDAILDSLGRTQNATFVNESGLYEVIIRSDSPKAKPFRKWVCSEVLPSIRNHGVYMTTETIAEVIKNPDLIIGMATELKKEQEARKKLQETVNKNKPKVEYADAILESEGSILIKELALWLQKNGIKIGQLKFYEWMRENDYTYKEGEMKNLPKQKWIEKGYFTLKKSKYTKDNNVMTSTTAKITEKGQQYFIEKFRSQTA